MRMKKMEKKGNKMIRKAQKDGFFMHNSPRMSDADMDRLFDPYFESKPRK